jgi:glycine/D-amino acid oxidase-like deaminating enzyme
MGVIEADCVVVAAGNGSPDILASVGVTLPMLTRPGVLVTTKPISAKIEHILVTTNGEVRQLPGGRILASAVANHQGDASEEVVETPPANTVDPEGVMDIVGVLEEAPQEVLPPILIE